MRAKVVSLAVGLAAVASVGCGGGGGGDSATTAQQTQTTPSSAKSATLTIKMRDFAFDPKNATASAGKVKVTAPNVGKVEHELVLFKTNRDPGSFKVSGDRVNEEALEKSSGVEEIGEIADVEAGEAKSETFKLPPGRYAMICNVPGHYKAGMYGSITVQ